MACKCAEIAKYDEDIETLEEALTYTQKIIDYQLSMNDSIDTLKSSYAKSVKGPDDLAPAFDLIHDGAIDNARMIRTQLEGALLTAKTKRALAIQEDDCRKTSG